tara:strand:+ start:285 stop:548 length:264 start_codon:yes stop_codon:yes gene_type:complete
MKKLIVLTLLLSVPNAFANRHMDRFDLDDDGFILQREITLSGCVVKAGTFEHADKNNDGRLNGKEANDAVAYLFNKRRCPKTENIRG